MDIDFHSYTFLTVLSLSIWWICPNQLSLCALIKLIIVWFYSTYWVCYLFWFSTRHLILRWVQISLLMFSFQRLTVFVWWLLSRPQFHSHTWLQVLWWCDIF
jgi:hypothetical protein